MAFDWAAVAGAAAAAGISSGTQAAYTGKQNRKSRRFTREMYQRQYDDNLALWNMTNEYNHPAAQMQRLKDAGLNPALVYGGSSGGSAGQASEISSPDYKMPEFRVPDMSGIADMGARLLHIYDVEIKKAQVDNLRADNTVKLEQAALTAAQTGKTLTDTALGNLQLEKDTPLVGIYQDAARENLRQMKANTDISLRRDEREAAMNSSNLQEAGERILSMRLGRAKTGAEISHIKQSIRNLRSDNELKRLDIELKKNGIQPHDPIWARVIAQHLESFSKPYTKLMDFLNAPGKKPRGSGGSAW